MKPPKKSPSDDEGAQTVSFAGDSIVPNSSEYRDELIFQYEADSLSHGKEFARARLLAEIDNLNTIYLETHAHYSADGYCCACGYDLAVFEGKLTQSNVEVLDRLLGRIGIYPEDSTIYSARKLRTMNGLDGYNEAAKKFKAIIERQKQELKEEEPK